MKEKLKCPVCGEGRLCDIDTESRLRYKVISVDKLTPQWTPELFLKCPKCGKEIAARKVS